MNDFDRQARNVARLAECHAIFANRVRLLINALEVEGWRPRIQDAWRSPVMQLQLLKEGTTRRSWGFHNATRADGTPDSLAVDLLDDDSPKDSRMSYCIALARQARLWQLDTGILWGLDERHIRAVEDAIQGGPLPAERGWDPTHVEPDDISENEARSGKRPK